jgi:hypothetical protein
VLGRSNIFRGPRIDLAQRLSVVAQRDHLVNLVIANDYGPRHFDPIAAVLAVALSTGIRVGNHNRISAMWATKIDHARPRLVFGLPILHRARTGFQRIVRPMGGRPVVDDLNSPAAPALFAFHQQWFPEFMEARK